MQRLRRWRRSSVLLLSLTLADTSWLMALPFLVAFHLDGLDWSLGTPLCKIIRLLYHNYFYLRYTLLRHSTDATRVERPDP